ncbi:hypothetical protein Syun_030016 [Stephania yunnanensis]|uniref:Uncharacterized protein n=1 Tax=Stephania yunnanensis TaxID=152371 RepID=A0AAP0EA11_9MAGN
MLDCSTTPLPHFHSNWLRPVLYKRGGLRRKKSSRNSPAIALVFHLSLLQSESCVYFIVSFRIFVDSCSIESKISFRKVAVLHALKSLQVPMV